MTNNLPTTALDHLAFSGKPADVALVVAGRAYTYQELNLCVSRLSGYLHAFGFDAGDRVATWTAKGVIACLMPLAAVRAGLVHIPVNPALKPAQVDHIMTDSGARLLIANKGRADTLARARSFDCVDEKEITAVLDDEGSYALPPLPDDFDVQTLAAILYTSGSTGRPKGVMLSHANLMIGALSVADYLGLSPGDITLAVLPLSFDYGQNQLFSTWQAGGCVVPLDYLTPRDVIKACAKHAVTTLAAVPPLWVQLVEQDWPEAARRSLRRLTNSGGALTPTLVRQLRAVFGKKTDIFAMYGLTEAFRSTYLDPALIDANPTSMGQAIPFAEIMIVTKDGRRAGPGEAGELVHAGPLVAQGYWRDDARTAERFKPAPPFSHYGGHAVYSGDTVRQDAGGLLYFVGRDDAMIKSSGNRVSPTEIEEAAIESGLVAEACALGRKDERTGEAIILFVRATDTQNEDALRAYMKASLPNFMQPSAYIWLSAFPKSANGKLDRNALVTRLADISSDQP